MSSKNLMQASKPNKVHYRMYKSGRHWLFASMTVVTVGSSLLWGNQVRAATTTPTNDESADQTAVSGTASVSSTVTLHESTSQGSSSGAASDDQQSETSATSQVSQASQTSQVTSESSSASQPPVSDKQSSQSSANTASQVSQATSESSSAGQSAVGVGQLSQAPANSIGATNQAKSVAPSEASVVNNQSLVAQPIVSSANEQADKGTLTHNLIMSDVTTANKMVATRASLLRDATSDSTFTWSIDDTGTTLTLNGGTPTESLYNILDSTKKQEAVT